MEIVVEENEMDRIYNVKYKINEYIESHLKYYIDKKSDEYKKERDKLHSALKDLFQNVELDEMADITKFCGNARFDYLCRKCRQPWGEKFIKDIYKIIIDRLK